MAFAYTVKDQGGVDFVTFTVHQWVDVFTRPIYVDGLMESLIYCQKHKGLEVFAWVVMSNHLHLIVRAKNGDLSDIIRDIKKFTAKSRSSSALPSYDYEGGILPFYVQSINFA